MSENHTLYIKYFSQNYALKPVLLPHANTQALAKLNVTSWVCQIACQCAYVSVCFTCQRAKNVPTSHFYLPAFQ